MMGYENTCLKNSRAISSRSRRIPRVPRLDGLMFYLYEDLTLSKIFIDYQNTEFDHKCIVIYYLILSPKAPGGAPCFGRRTISFLGKFESSVLCILVA